MSNKQELMLIESLRCARHCAKCLASTMKEEVILAPSYRWGDRGSERWYNLPNTTHLMNVGGLKANGLSLKPVILIIMLCCILGRKLPIPGFEKLHCITHGHFPLVTLGDDYLYSVLSLLLVLWAPWGNIHVCLNLLKKSLHCDTHHKMSLEKCVIN